MKIDTPSKSSSETQINGLSKECIKTEDNVIEEKILCGSQECDNYIKNSSTSKLDKKIKKIKKIKRKSVELSDEEIISKPKKRNFMDDDDEDFITVRKKKTSKKIKEDDDSDFEMEFNKKSSLKKEDNIKKSKAKTEHTPKEEVNVKEEQKTKKTKKTKTGDSDAKKKDKRKKVKKVEKTEKVKTEQKKRTKTAAKTVETWKWWEEEPLPEGIKWLKLQHNGPCFPPDYEPLPSHINFYYDSKPLKLSKDAEEVASFYAKMLDHDYTKKEIFNNNFFGDWREIMTKEEQKIIKDLKKCDFKKMADYYTKLQEQKKEMSKEDKDKIKLENQAIQEKYGVCVMDGHEQKVGNYRVEPPGLFRGRGDHPKQGKLKKRVHPSNVTINIGKEAVIPEPPYGKWKSVSHDNTVAWLATWNENILGNYKYVMLNPTAKLKGQKDMEKFNIARNLRDHIDKIRKNYKDDWKFKDMKTRQRAVALYFIDKLALRAGHEKEEGESADTVGCCSLRVEHIKLHPTYEGDEYVVEFDFLGKDSIRYQNFVPIEKQVYKNLKLFMKKKEPSDDLFDRLTTASLNRYLNDLMNNLTAKVFRTYNASSTLQQQLDLLTQEESTINEKVLSYNRANRAVAILCNHQRSVPKTFEKTMENLNNKLVDKKKEISTLRHEIKELKHEDKNKHQKEIEKKKKKLKTAKEQRLKMKLNITDRDENKEIALGTSKLNYLDPRITVAWCKKFNVPLEKVYAKTYREKFQWAIDMADESFIF